MFSASGSLLVWIGLLIALFIIAVCIFLVSFRRSTRYGEVSRRDNGSLEVRRGAFAERVPRYPGSGIAGPHDQDEEQYSGNLSTNERERRGGDTTQR